MDYALKGLKEAKKQRGIEVEGLGEKIGIPNEPKLPKYKDTELKKIIK